MRQVSKFFHLPSVEKCLLFRAWILLGVIRLGLELFPFSTSRKFFNKRDVYKGKFNRNLSEDIFAWSAAIPEFTYPLALEKKVNGRYRRYLLS
jgi:hypothetical protein